MLLTKIYRTGAAGRYLLTRVPFKRPGPCKWADGQTFETTVTFGGKGRSYAYTTVPKSFPAEAGQHLLWLKKQPLTTKRLKGWPGLWTVTGPEGEYYVLIMPREARARVEHDVYLVWLPLQQRQQLIRRFSPDGVWASEELRFDGQSSTVKHRGIVIFDEDYNRYRLSCPFCKRKVTVETFQPLFWQGQCKCGVQVRFVPADDVWEIKAAAEEEGLAVECRKLEPDLYACFFRP